MSLWLRVASPAVAFYVFHEQGGSCHGTGGATSEPRSPVWVGLGVNGALQLIWRSQQDGTEAVSRSGSCIDSPTAEILLFPCELGEPTGAERLLVVFINFLSRAATCHQIAPRHQRCLAVFSLPRRSQNVKLVELTRSDREILHVWPGCLSKFGVVLVVWGKCWKLLEI